VARLIGRTERWLRETEKTDKIPRARRDLNNWRVYTEEDVETLSRLINGNGKS
jgi:hypothetical protein